MKEDEYDLFLSDPSDFIVRVWLPRVFGIMQPLTKMPPLMNISMNLGPLVALFASPEFKKLAPKPFTSRAARPSAIREKPTGFRMIFYPRSSSRNLSGLTGSGLSIRPLSWAMMLFRCSSKAGGITNSIILWTTQRAAF